MATPTLLSRGKGRYRRTLARVFARRPFKMCNTHALISFTFDDFPRSAFQVASPLLEKRGVRATYYTSFGLMSHWAPTGQIFHCGDLPSLLEAGHELGCHTFDHCHAWETPSIRFEESICRNREKLRELVPVNAFESLSYPISCPRPGIKRRVGKYFAAGRAGGQTFNSGRIDLYNLQAFFIEQSRERPDAIKTLIDATVAATGWLILATHDVSASPTRYGCTPALFKAIVDYSVASGARVLPVSEALREIGVLKQL